MTTTLQAEADIVIVAKAEQAAFDKRLQDARDASHQAMLADLRVRCEAKKNALREERFWDMINEEAASFEY